MFFSHHWGPLQFLCRHYGSTWIKKDIQIHYKRRIQSHWCQKKQQSPHRNTDTVIHQGHSGDNRTKQNLSTTQISGSLRPLELILWNHFSNWEDSLSINRCADTETLGWKDTVKEQRENNDKRIWEKSIIHHEQLRPPQVSGHYLTYIWAKPEKQQSPGSYQLYRLLSAEAHTEHRSGLSLSFKDTGLGDVKDTRARRQLV